MCVQCHAFLIKLIVLALLGQIHLMENSDGMELNAQAQKLCLREQG